MVGRLSPRARALTLLPLCSLLVHDGRFHLGYGPEAGHELARQGHGYMSAAKPLVLILCMLLAADLVARLARAWRLGQPDERPGSRIRLGIVCSLALAAGFAGQELIEGAVVSGHPSGLAGVFGAGGWIALPLSVIAGALVALVLAGTRAAARALAARARGPLTGPASAARSAPRAPRTVATRRVSPLAAAAAGRAPPFLVVCA